MFNNATLAQALLTVYLTLDGSGRRRDWKADLVGEPHSIGTASLLFIWILLYPLEQKDESIDRPTKFCIRQQAISEIQW